MDLIYRKQKYQDYLSRLEAIKGDVSTQRQVPKQEFTDLNNRLSDQLKAIKELTDKSVIKQAYYLLGIPTFLLLLFNLYKTGFGPAVFFIVLLVVFFFIADNFMKALITHSQQLIPAADVNQSHMTSYLLNKLEYVSSGLDIKKYRAILLGIFFLLFFPALLFYTFNLITHSLSSSTVWLIAFAVSVVYWSFYFNKQLAPLKEIEEELTVIDHELNQLLA